MGPVWVPFACVGSDVQFNNIIIKQMHLASIKTLSNGGATL